MGPAIFFASIARNQDQLGSDAVWGLPEAPAGVVEFQSRSGLAGEETSLVIHDPTAAPGGPFGLRPRLGIFDGSLEVMVDQKH
jgi:hypothetical protein